jgi:hypothetical protein
MFETTMMLNAEREAARLRRPRARRRYHRKGPRTSYVIPPDGEPLVPRCEEK